MNLTKAELIVRGNMKSLFGIDNVEVYERSFEEGKWCLTIAFFPTRGADYEETKKCCVEENGEIHWKR